MKPALHIIVATIALVPIIAVSIAIADKPAPKASSTKPADHIASMNWLAGTWSGQMWGGTFEAYYTTPEGGRILSHSRLLKNDKIAFYEFEMFEVRDDALHMLPFPGGKKVVGLMLAKLDHQARKATFENKTKDYPTRIEYHRAADDRLVITLTDPHGKSDKREVFELKRNAE